ncbi:MAG: biotin/lipoyl-binding protein [Clostridia bacterium]|nr:biotin/lipoyl-binding protein [Clostridia bacterium]
MRKFSVTVNGSTYEVIVEEVAADATVTPVAAPVAAPAPVAAAPAPKAAAPKPAATGAAGSVSIKSPFPGTVLKVNVAPGQAVKKDETLMVIEAMKMENEIKAPQDGTVASVNVTKGASVNTDDLLCSLK